MKKIWKYIAACAVVASMMPLAACDDDDTVDPYEINYCYLYQPNTTFAQVEYKANGEFMSGLSDPLKIVPVRLTKPAPRNLQIEVAIDPTLVDEYNEANGTEYKFLEGATIDNPIMNIAAGEYITQDSITVSFGDHSGFMNQESNLILPIVIRNGAGLTISKSSRIFLTFNSTYRPNKLSPVAAQQFKAGILNQGWEETVRTLNVNNGFNLSYAPYEEVKINIAIDQSKVAEYNADHNTNYQFKSDARLVASTLTVGTDANAASFSINTGDLSGLANENQYIIPVTVTSVEGASIELDDQDKTVYVIVKGVGRELSVSVNEHDGDAIDNPVSCTVDGKDWLSIINPDSWDYSYIASNTPMEIDFGKSVNLSSFRINHWSASYSARSLTLETSVDGSTWLDWGEVSYTQSGTYYVNLSSATPVRYMRLVFTSGPNRIEIDDITFFGK